MKSRWHSFAMAMRVSTGLEAAWFKCRRLPYPICSMLSWWRNWTSEGNPKDWTMGARMKSCMQRECIWMLEARRWRHFEVDSYSRGLTDTDLLRSKVPGAIKIGLPSWDTWGNFLEQSNKSKRFGHEREGEPGKECFKGQHLENSIIGRQSAEIRLAKQKKDLPRGA